MGWGWEYNVQGVNVGRNGGEGHGGKAKWAARKVGKVIMVEGREMQ